MALEFSDLQRVPAHLTTTLTDLYTCPASTKAKITHVQSPNVDGTNEADVTLALVVGENTYYYLKGAPTPAGSAIKPLGDLVGANLMAGDKLQGAASADGDLDIIISLTEYTVS